MSKKNLSIIVIVLIICTIWYLTISLKDKDSALQETTFYLKGTVEAIIPNSSNSIKILMCSKTGDQIEILFETNFQLMEHEFDIYDESRNSKKLKIIDYLNSENNDNEMYYVEGSFDSNENIFHLAFQDYELPLVLSSNEKLEKNELIFNYYNSENLSVGIFTKYEGDELGMEIVASDEAILEQIEEIYVSNSEDDKIYSIKKQSENNKYFFNLRLKNNPHLNIRFEDRLVTIPLV